MTSASAYCGSCGAATAGAKFCTACGAPTAGQSAVIDLRAQQEAVTQTVSRSDAQTDAAGAPASPFAPAPAWNGAPVVPSTPAAAPFVQQSTSAGASSVADRTHAPALAEPRNDGGSSRRNLWLGGAVAVVVVLALVAGLLFVARGGSGDETSAYQTQAVATLAPLAAANASLRTSMAALKPGADDETVNSQAQTAAALATSARQALQAAPSTGADAQFATRVQAALTAELAWLAAVQAGLKDPASGQVAQLSSLGVTAESSVSALSPEVPAFAAGFPSSQTLVTYLQARASTQNLEQAELAFSKQVKGLLDQSRGSFTQINQLFAELSRVAAGGYTGLTLAQANQTFTTVISNRTALQSSAQSLSAPAGPARDVRAALVTAFGASLTNDKEIFTCFNQANDGNFAIIFQSCLSSTQSSSSAATTAKARFKRLYNDMRGRLGQPAVNESF